MSPLGPQLLNFKAKSWEKGAQDTQEAPAAGLGRYWKDRVPTVRTGAGVSEAPGSPASPRTWDVLSTQLKKQKKPKQNSPFLWVLS